MYGVSDLDERFNYYPEYQEPLQLLKPLQKWLTEVQGDVYVKKIPILSERTRSLISLHARGLAEEYSILNPNDVTLFFNAVAVTRLFQAIGMMIPYHSSFIVPGHFVSQLPVWDNETPFPLLHK